MKEKKTQITSPEQVSSERILVVYEGEEEPLGVVRRISNDYYKVVVFTGNPRNFFGDASFRDLEDLAAHVLSFPKAFSLYEYSSEVDVLEDFLFFLKKKGA